MNQEHVHQLTLKDIYLTLPEQLPDNFLTISKTYLVNECRRSGIARDVARKRFGSDPAIAAFIPICCLSSRHDAAIDIWTVSGYIQLRFSKPRIV
jgi:hypothetical protein